MNQYHQRQLFDPSVLSSWDSALSSLLSTVQRLREEDASRGSGQLKRLLLELVALVVQGQVSVAQMIQFLQQAGSTSVVSEGLADVFWLLGVETETSKEERERLVSLVKEVLAKGFISSDLMKERAELDLLLGIGLIKSREIFQRKVSRVSTKDTATQQKFNLFREESEGYAKLIVELNGCKNYQSSGQLYQSVLGLSGQFDLDPNRVFDVVLDCLEYSIDNRDTEKVSILLEVVGFVNRTTLANLIGFKFQYYQHEDVKESTPKSLYSLCALLIKRGLLTTDEVYPHLRPSDEEAKVWHEKDIENAINAAKRAGRSNIALAAEKKTEVEDEKPIKRDNQKLGLIEGMLDQGDWTNADFLLSRLSTIDPGSHPPIARALCKKIDSMIEPLYRPMSDKMFGRVQANANGDNSVGIDNFEELPQRLFPILRYLGVHVSQNVVLYVKLCRLFVEYNARFPDKGPRILETLLSISLLPGLTLIPANPGVVNELWELLKPLPYTVRFKLYGKWKNFYYETYPPLIMAKELANKEIKKIMRRLSKENVKQLGRMLGKVSHNNPIIIFSHIIDQIEAYDNLILPVADAVKYVTNLGYDVLSYLIIESLAAPKNKMKADGTNVSQWLQGLAAFSGVLFKKYPATMELNAMVQYLFLQLNRESSLDLLVLKELIAKMSGVEIIEDISETQLEAHGGGEVLRIESSPLQQARTLKRPAGKLRDALISNQLMLPLFVRLTLQRSNVLFTTQSSTYLKLVGDLYDKCHETLLQYIEFWISYVDKKTYAGLLPPLPEFVRSYHIEPEVAFALLRPVLPLLFDDTKTNTSAALRPSLIAESTASSNGSESNEALAQANTSTEDETSKRTLVAAVQQLLPNTVWASISPEIYSTFWSLSLYDIYVPRERYQAEIAKNRLHAQNLDSKEAETAVAATKRKKDKEKFVATISKLEKELAQQEQHHKEVMKQILQEKDKWLASCTARQDTVTQFLQNCVFPRCVFSATDALYCAKFVHLLHNIGTPFFSTLQCYDKMLRNIPHLLFSCTENEASRLGRFLNETLAVLARWRSDEKVYEKECASVPGFSTQLLAKPDDSQRATYKEFIAANIAWQSVLAKAFTACLSSKEYLEIRNALTVLIKIVKVFPVWKRIMPSLEQRVAKIKEDSREDLKVLATRYYSLLEKQKQETVNDVLYNYHPQTGKDIQASAGAAPSTSPSPSLAPTPTAVPAPTSSPATTSAQPSLSSATAPAVTPAPALSDTKPQPALQQSQPQKPVSSTSTRQQSSMAPAPETQTSQKAQTKPPLISQPPPFVTGTNAIPATSLVAHPDEERPSKRRRDELDEQAKLARRAERFRSTTEDTTPSGSTPASAPVPASQARAPLPPQSAAVQQSASKDRERETSKEREKRDSSKREDVSSSRDRDSKRRKEDSEARERESKRREKESEKLRKDERDERRGESRKEDRRDERREPVGKDRKDDSRRTSSSSSSSIGDRKSSEDHRRPPPSSTSSRDHLPLPVPVASQASFSADDRQKKDDHSKLRDGGSKRQSEPPRIITINTRGSSQQATSSSSGLLPTPSQAPMSPARSSNSSSSSSSSSTAKEKERKQRRKERERDRKRRRQ